MFVLLYVVFVMHVFFFYRKFSARAPHYRCVHRCVRRQRGGANDVMETCVAGVGWI